MRSLVALFACLMLVVSAWGAPAQAAAPACSEMAEQVAVHVAGDCDEVPADAHKNYPHCHTGCHGHHVTAAVPTRAPAPAFTMIRVYSLSKQPALTAHHVDQTLRPPQA